MKRLKRHLVHTLKRNAVKGIALLALAGSLVTARADSTPFSRIFVFGDSLSDTGNFYHLSGGFPPSPYADGRFSNGQLWVEYVAEALSMKILSGDNYAVGGATTGRDNGNDGFAGQQYPGLQDQIDSFCTNHSAGDVSGALFVVWAGANDFFVALQSGASPQTLIGNGVGNTVEAIQRLGQRGARHIIVVNIPDLGLTPFARNAGLSAPITQLSAVYNQTLGATLDALENAGISTIRVDAFATIQAMSSKPAEFGFTNVTQALLATGGDPGSFLFWDQVHPTTRGHEVLAGEALDSLINHFSPRQGNGVPASRINALHGLVPASNFRGASAHSITGQISTWRNN